MHRRACCLLAGLVALGLLAAVRQGGAAGQLSGENLVPLDVRVLDRAGKPITDLNQGDFVVLENGVSRPIRQFAYRTYAAGPAAPASLTPRKGMALRPQTGRILAIVLGRGRLEDPSRSVTALIQFVRTKLLPQDLVAVFAYDRALPFTADHEKAAQVLERFRKVNADVNLEIELQMGPTGMAPLYGRKVLPAKVQNKINEVFDGPGAGKTPAIANADTFDAGAFATLSLDDFMFSSAQTLTDQSSLNVLSEYLRRYEGEKHVLYVSAGGFPFPSDQGDANLASLANDARATIHTLQAGPIVQTEAGKEMASDLQQTLSLKSLRTIADLTGGEWAIIEKSGAALDQVDAVSRGSYAIGFEPSGGWDGQYRKLEVRVNRPDVTVRHRHGYFAAPEAGGFSSRGQVTSDRLMAAGNFRREVDDIKVKTSISQPQAGTLRIEGRIDLSKITLVPVAGGRSTTLEVAIVGLDSGGDPVGSEVRSVAVKMTEDEFQKYKKDGFPYSLDFPMPRNLQTIRFIVYDYLADIIGRKDTKVF